MAVDILLQHNTPWRTITIVGNIKRLLTTLAINHILHVYWRQVNQPMCIMAMLVMGDEKITLNLIDFLCNLLDAVQNDLVQCTYIRL